jgi:hypothetical protein
MGLAANSTPLCAKAIMYSRCAGNTGKSFIHPHLAGEGDYEQLLAQQSCP